MTCRALGALLLVAGLLKGYELASGPLVDTGVFGNRFFMAVAVEAEAILGVWLLSGFYPRPAARAAFACFSLFAAYTFWKGLSGAHSCGCFGRVPVNPWFTFTIDLAALPAALWAGLGPRTSSSASRLRPALAALACLVVGLPAFLKMTLYHTQTAPDRQIVVIDSQKWPGQPWPLAQYVAAWPELARGRWAVLLYSWSCGHCPEMVQAYGDLAADWQARGAPQRVALIDTAADAPPADLEKLLNQLPVLRARLQTPAEWFITSPTVVVLKDGRVVTVAEGDEDCQWDDARLGRW